MISTFMSCSMFQNYRPDNPAEEMVEGLIDQYTGFDLDFTPNSPEWHR